MTDEPIFERILQDVTSHLPFHHNNKKETPAMSKLTDDVAEAFKNIEDWVDEAKNRLQPVAAEVEKYADPFIQTLSTGLAAAGIVVPVKYADIALNLVAKLTQLDPTAAAPATPVAATPAPAAADATPAEPLPAQ